jgi:hypothetical protein
MLVIPIGAQIRGGPIAHIGAQKAWRQAVVIASSRVNSLGL